MSGDAIKFNPQQEHSATTEQITPNMQPDSNGCAEKEPYALQVLGLAMEPDFPDGSIIIIEPHMRPVKEAFMVVEVDGENWFRQYRESATRQYLFASNDIYPDIELAQTDWRVIGIIRQRNCKRDIKHFNYEFE